MRRRVLLGAFVGLLLLSATLEAQYGWFTQNGGLIARMSSSATAVTIRQDGSGAIFDLYDGASRVFRMADGGQAQLADGEVSAPSLAFADDTATGMYSQSNGSVDIAISGARAHAFNADALAILDAAANIRFGLTGPVFLVRDGADALALRNSTNPQTLVLGTVGSVAGTLQMGPTLFAALGSPGDGTVRYCSDCTKATPCAGSGSGAIAKRINGAWDCD